jgi:hypothetical protein
VSTSPGPETLIQKKSAQIRPIRVIRVPFFWGIFRPNHRRVPSYPKTHAVNLLTMTSDDNPLPVMDIFRTGPPYPSSEPENKSTDYQNKEDIMKTVHAIIATMVLAATAYAQSSTANNYFAQPARYSSVDAPRAASVYTANLSSNNEGVVESSLAHLAMMKLMLPANDFQAAEAKAAELAKNYPSQETRYKAFLTRTVIDNPAMFAGLETRHYAHADEFFGVIAAKLAETIAAR